MQTQRMSLNIAKAIVKSLACIWVGRPDLIAEIGIDSLEDLFGQFIPNLFIASSLKDKFSPYSTEIAKGIDDFLKNVDLPDGSKESISQGILDTLKKTHYTLEDFNSWNYHSELMAKHLYDKSNLTGYSSREKSYFRKGLQITSKYILNLLPEFPQFKTNIISETFDRFDHMNDTINKISQITQSIEQAILGKELSFETDYRECVANTYSKTNMFAASIDNHLGIYDLPVSYVYLQAEIDKYKHVDMEELFSLTRGNGLAPKKKILMIVGHAGAGKTTFLQWLAVNVSSRSQLIQKRIPELSVLIPVLIPLRQIHHWDTTIIENQINSLLAPLSLKIPDGWVADLAKSGKLLLLIDGLDEINTESQDQAINWLDTWRQKYPYNQIVITSRPIDKLSAFRDICRAYIMPMTVQKTRIFINNWHKAVLVKNLLESEETANAYASNTRAQIFANTSLRKLARNPLLCAMLCALSYKRNSVLPKNKIEIYEECTKMLLDDRDAHRNIKASSKIQLDYSTKTLLLDELSYWMMRNNRTLANKQEVIDFIGGRIPYITAISDDTAPEEILNYFLSRSGILREPIEGKIDYIHKTFLEYMAAREIARQCDWNALLQKIDEPSWHETILLAIGFANCQQASKFIESIVHKSKTASNKTHQAYYALLALSCTENAKSLYPTCKTLVLKTAKDFIPPSNDNWLNMQNLGDWIIPLLKNKVEYSPRQRLQCVSFLSECISSVAQVDALKTYFDFNPEDELVTNLLSALHECKAAHIKEANIICNINAFLFYHQNPQKATKTFTIPDTLFDLYAKIRHSANYNFGSVKLQNTGNEISSQNYLNITCKTLFLSPGLKKYDILKCFCVVKQLTVYCGEGTPTDTLFSYSALNELQKLTYVLQDDSFLLIGQERISKSIKSIHIIFETEQFELLFGTNCDDSTGVARATQLLSGITEVILDFKKASHLGFYGWDRVAFKDAVLYFSKANVRVKIAYNDLEPFLQYSDIAAVSKEGASRLVLDIYDVPTESAIEECMSFQAPGITYSIASRKKLRAPQ